MTDNLQALYNGLKDQYDLGTLDDFKRNMDDETVRRNIYNAVSSQYDVEDNFDAFSRSLGYNTGNAVQSATQANQQMIQSVTPAPQMEPAAAAPAPAPVDETPKYLKRPEETFDPLGEPTIQPQAQAQPSYAMVNPEDLNKEEKIAAAQPLAKQLRATADEIRQQAKASREEDKELEQKYYELTQAARDYATAQYGPQPNKLSSKEGWGKAYEDYLKDNDPDHVMDRYDDVKGRADRAGYNSFREHMANRIERRAKQTEMQAESTGVGRTLKSELYGLTKPSTWSFGLSDLWNEENYLSLANKLERGEQLTEEEQGALDAYGAYQDALKTMRQYDTPMAKAGEMTGEMVPFVLQMIFNPAGSLGRALEKKAFGKVVEKATSKEVAKQTAKEAMEKYADMAMKDAIKQYGVNGAKARAAVAAGRVGGDLASAVVLANTLQAPSTVAGTIERKYGDPVKDGEHYELDPKQQQSWAESTWKQELSSTIENFTEMMGEWKALGVVEKMENFATKPVARIVRAISDGDFAKGLSKVLREGQWSGILGEALEEEYGIVLNSLLGTGDNKISDLWDRDQQIDILLGVSLFGGMMGGVKLGAYPIEYTNAKKRLQEVSQNCREGGESPEEWDKKQAAIDSATDEGLQAIMASALNKRDQARERGVVDGEAENVIQYITALQKYRGMTIARDLLPGDVDTKTQQDFYLQGYSGQDNQAITTVYRNKEQQLNLIDPDLINLLESEGIDGTYPDGTQIFQGTTKMLALDYLDAKAAYEGMLQGISDRAELKAASARAVARSNDNNGRQIEATTRSGEKVYIIDGEVEMVDGNANMDKSSKSIVIRHEDGKKEMVSPLYIKSIDGVQNTEEVARMTAERAAQESLEQDAAAAEPANDIVATQSVIEADMAADKGKAEASYERDTRVTLPDGTTGVVLQARDPEDGQVEIRWDNAVNRPPVEHISAEDLYNLEHAEASAPETVQQDNVQNTEGAARLSVAEQAFKDWTEKHGDNSVNKLNQTRAYAQEKLSENEAELAKVNQQLLALPDIEDDEIIKQQTDLENKKAQLEQDINKYQAVLGQMDAIQSVYDAQTTEAEQPAAPVDIAAPVAEEQPQIVDDGTGVKPPLTEKENARLNKLIGYKQKRRLTKKEKAELDELYKKSNIPATVEEMMATVNDIVDQANEQVVTDEVKEAAKNRIEELNALSKERALTDEERDEYLAMTDLAYDTKKAPTRQMSRAWANLQQIRLLMIPLEDKMKSGEKLTALEGDQYDKLYESYMRGLKDLVTDRDIQEAQAQMKAYQEKTGIKMRLLLDLNDATETEKKGILEHHSRAWNAGDKEAVFYLPMMKHTGADFGQMYRHEVLSHFSLKNSMSEEKWDEFLDRVWNVMAKDERERMDRLYRGAYKIDENGNEVPDEQYHRLLADEFIATNAQDMYKKYRNVAEKIYDWVANWIRGGKRSDNPMDRPILPDFVMNSLRDVAGRRIEKREDKKEGTRQSIAYHGSGADFDQFDSKFMSTGEGNQAYGWGTYVTTNKETGKSYADVAASTETGDYKPGTSVKDIIATQINAAMERDPLLDFNQAKEEIKDDSRIAKEDLDAFTEDDLKNHGARVLYTVEIPDDNGENYLHWDGMLTQRQSDKIVNALLANPDVVADLGEEAEREVKSSLGYGTYGKNVNGALNYFLGNGMNYATGVDEGAERNSKFLNSLGIVGMQVAVDRNGGKRFEGDNYVIYNPDDIQIKDKTRFSVDDMLYTDEMKQIRDAAKADGTFMLAPNGQPTNLDERQWLQVRTEAFKNWFGDWQNDPVNASKVVDENGEPRVVYHGSNWNPLLEEPGKAVFDEERVGQNFEDVDIDFNFFFTASEAAAKGYGVATPVFLNIRNMEKHVISEPVNFQLDEETGHDIVINAHDAGSEYDNVTRVDNPDGVQYTIRTVDTTEADRKFREAIDQWEGEHKEEIEARLNELSTRTNELNDAITEERRRLYNEMGLEEQFGMTFDAFNERNEHTLQSLIESVAKIRNIDTAVYDDLMKQLGEASAEEFKLIQRIDIEGRPEWEQFADANTTYDYTVTDLYALDDPNNIKSATANDGSFSTTDNDIRYSVTPEMDAAYMEAINNGDMDEAQMLVREAASYAMPDTKIVGRDGMPKVVYHGTRGRFNSFRYNPDDIGFHFGDRSTARSRVGRGKETIIMPVYLNMVNPIKMDTDLGAWDADYLAPALQKIGVLTEEEANSMLRTPEGYKRNGTLANRDLRNLLNEKGYDGIIYTNTFESDGKPSYLVFRINQMKSAETVTRDREGNIIPLSERFNDRSGDIRFSIADEDTEDVFNRALENYGTTDYSGAAGYMMPDGQYLDFSEGSGVRITDHRNVGLAYENTADEAYEYMYDFMRRGAIRMKPESGGFELAVVPTPEQRRRLREYIAEYNGDVIMDILNPEGGNPISAEYAEVEPSRVLGDIDRYFNEGIKPISDVRYSVIDEANKEQKRPNEDYDIDEADIRYSLSNNNRQTINAWLNKREDLSKEEKENVLNYVSNIDNPTLQLATGRWYAKGTIRLPEDMDKVEQAVEVARKAKVDPMQYDSPMQLINEHADIKVKAKPINPDDVSTLHKAAEYPEQGIVVYDVDESDESRENMRKIINTHFGVQASPWCLLQGDGKGNLTEESKRYWDSYNAYPKQVAFKDGKLIAFSANNFDRHIWWDRMDRSQRGLPVGEADMGDGRKQSIMFVPGEGIEGYGPIYRGDRVDGVYEEWFPNGQLRERVNYKNHKLNGPSELWYENGYMRRRQNYEDGFPIGLIEEWHQSTGTMSYRYNRVFGGVDGLFESWFVNGRMEFRSNWKDGKQNGIEEVWNSKGKMTGRSMWKNGRKVKNLELTNEKGERAPGQNAVREEMPRFSLPDEDQVRYSVREKAAPKKTIKVYKLMRLQDGKVYPLYIDASTPIEMGTWYDADSPALDMLKDKEAGIWMINPKTGEAISYDEFYQQHPDLFNGKQTKLPTVEAINWATGNGYRFMSIKDTDKKQNRYGENRQYYNLGINGAGEVGEYALRPGWHAGSLPTMRQIGKGPKRNLRDDSFVWVEGEISADKDYNEEAQQNPDKDIPGRIPEDGFYLKATNADKVKSQADQMGWYVAGSFKPNRIISDSEANQIIDQWNAEHPEAKVKYDYRRESGKVFNAETMSLEETRYHSPAEIANNEGISLETATKLVDKDQTMQGGVVMNDDAAHLMDETGYMTPNELDTRFSTVTWDMAGRMAYMNRPGARKEVVAALDNMADMMKADELVMEFVPTGIHRSTASGDRGPLRTNVEYMFTFDLDTTCPRTFQSLYYVQQIEKRLGRFMTQLEMVQLNELMRAYGQQIPCVYCYAENKRQAKKQYMLDYIVARRLVKNATSDEAARRVMYGRSTGKGSVDGLTPAADKVLKEWRADRNGYNPDIRQLTEDYRKARNAVLVAMDEMKDQLGYDERKTAKTVARDFCEAHNITDKKVISAIETIAAEWLWDVRENRDHQNFDPKKAWMSSDALRVWKEMTDYGNSASGAKSVLTYVPYTDELAQLTKQQKKNINSMGGLRMHSSNDFRIDYVFDYLQLMADMEQAKMMGHTYTKSPAFVEIFGNTGYRINMSVAAYQDENGNIIENHDEGFDWQQAQTLRQIFENAGTLFMATSNEQLQWGLDTDWIDMIIPFHHSGLDKKYWYNLRHWTDYTASQNERFYTTADMKAKLEENGIEVPKTAKAGEIYDMFVNSGLVKVIYDNKGNRVKPHFLPGESIQGGNKVPGWHKKGNTPAEDDANYKKLCAEYGVYPRFQGIEVKDAEGQMIDVTMHPYYIKLIKETSRMDSEQTPIKFNMDQPYSEKAGELNPALKGKTPLQYAMELLKAQAQVGYENDPRYEHNDQWGVVDTFMKVYADQNRPMDYLPREAREIWRIMNEAVREKYGAWMEDNDATPYHPATDNTRHSLFVPAKEYAVISHQIFTYPEKIERAHVFTANNYYLCANIDDENGTFDIVATLPIVGNEDLINTFRARNAGRVLIPIKDAADVRAYANEVRSRGGRVSGDISPDEGRSGRDGRDVSMDVRQSSEPTANTRQAGENGEGENTRHSITPEQDAEYRKAFEDKDTEKAMQMLKSAFIARYPNTKVILANGEPQVVYHGTPSPAFTTFAKPGVNLQGLVWLSQEEEYAGTYAMGFNEEEYKDYSEPYAPQDRGVYQLFANIVNPLNIGYIEDVVGSDTWNELAGKLDMTPEELFDRIGWDGSKYENSVKQADPIYELTRGAKFVSLLKEKGYDGVEAWEGDDQVATYGAVNSNQVKSAEPFVLDDNGKLIPLSERFSESDDIRYSVTAADDKAYLEAVNNGDMKTAARMVEDAAKKAGYTQKAYRVNPSGWLTAGEDPNKYHTTTGVSYAEDLEYYEGSDTGYKAKDAKPYFINTDDFFDPMKQLKLDVNTWSDMRGSLKEFEKYDIEDEMMVDGAEDEAMTSTDGLAYAGKRLGYKGTILRDIPQTQRQDSKGFTEYAVYDSNSVKSGDTVTYDENGNIIPLSERFNPKNEDIRFSIIGEIGAGNDQTSEGLIRLQNLQIARDMESELKPSWFAKDDADALKIKAATGWERGADGLWRYEVPDAQFKDGALSKRWGGNTVLSDIVEAPEVFRAYPRLANIKVKRETKKNLGGRFEYKDNLLTINTSDYSYYLDRIKEAQEAGYNPGNYIERADKWYKHISEYLVHELQHAIQAEEGFARGGNPNMTKPGYDKDNLEKMRLEYNDMVNKYNAMTPWERSLNGAMLSEIHRRSREYDRELKSSVLGREGYRRLAGEVESRNVERRREMDANEKRNTLLAMTEDIARPDQIKIYRAIGEADILDSAVTPAEDTTYMEAVDNGDMLTAQRMVDREMAKAGYTYRAYHGSPVADITTFDIDRTGMHTNAYDDRAFWFTPRADFAEQFSYEFLPGSSSFTVRLGDKGRVYNVALKMNNPLDMREPLPEDVKQMMAENAYAGFANVTPELIERKLQDISELEKIGNHQLLKMDLNYDRLRDMGYDGIIANLYTYEQAQNDENRAGVEYGVFGPSQIKSADAVTFDDEGDVIPLSERFNEESNDIRYSITPEMNEEYRKAFEDKDVEKARQLVKQAFLAKFPNTTVLDENGEPRVVYHGSPWGSFNNFEAGGGVGNPIYFAVNKQMADDFAHEHDGEQKYYEETITPRVYDVFVNIENLAELGEVSADVDDELLSKWAKAIGATDEEMKAAYETAPYGLGYDLLDWNRSINDLIRSKGFDGFHGYEYNKETGEQYGVYDPKNIKSADPFTFDNEGNLIPLSERFNDTTDDIRYSFVGEQAAASLKTFSHEWFMMSDLNDAKAMERQGRSAEWIKSITGWERGADGKWRYEMEDLELNDDFFMAETIGEAVKESRLLTAYPKLKDMKVEFVYKEQLENASYSEDGFYIEYEDEFQAEEVLAHEIQHYIQDQEGFAEGASATMFDENADNMEAVMKEVWDIKDDATLEDIQKGIDDSKADSPKREAYNSVYILAASGYTVKNAKAKLISESIANDSPFRKYHRAAGEVEARNVEARMIMSLEERMNTLASATEDVAREDQIMIFNGEVKEFQAENEPIMKPVGDLTGTRYSISIEPSNVRSEYNNGDIVVYNPRDIADIQASVLRETYTHKDIRNLEGWDQFMDTAYKMGSDEIAENAVRNGFDFDAATEDWIFANADRMVAPFEKMMSQNNIDLRYSVTGDEIKMYLTKRVGLLEDADLLVMREDLPTEASVRFSTTGAPSARDLYDASQQSTLNNLYRAYIDYSKPLRDFQEIIAKESGTPIKDFENAWEAENQRASRSKAEIEKYETTYFEAMRDAVKALEQKANITYEEVLRYLIAKHGLERNVVLAQREADAEYKKYKQKNPNGSKTVDDFFRKNRKRDFSGLTALSGKDKVTEAEAYAEDLVYVIESAAKAETDALWDAIGNAVAEIQKKRYDSGLISKSQMEHEANMFQHYIPLRGFAETIAEDVYEYYEDAQRNRPQRDKKAKGRTSLADDPLATIGAMAASAITQGNKNLVKQRFLNMVENHPTDLATVKDVWLVNTGTPTDPVWEPAYPDIQEGMTADQITKAMKDYDDRMDALQSMGMAQKATNKLNIQWRTLGAQAQQHIVPVLRGGKEQMIIINGNPQVARTVNGINNPDAQVGPGLQKWKAIQRFMAANFTTRNPAFVVSNLLRDVGFATMAVMAKEDAAYKRAFMGNLTHSLVTITNMGTLIRKWQNGTLDTNNEIERYFQEFMDFGGETGYTAENTVDSFRRKMQKGLKDKNAIVRGGEAMLDFFELCNRSVEDMTRFTTYLTSRQMGRSVQRSVADAKNITVNFNRKGSGEMGQKIFASCYLFLNAGIQSLQNIAKISGIEFGLDADKNKIKINVNGKKLGKSMAVLFGSQIMMGMVVPMLNELMMGMLGGDDDDDPVTDENGVVIETNPYRRLTEFERRNNFCIWIGGDNFIKIPIAIELRAFYGLGETIYGYMAGIPNPNPGTDVMDQMLDLLPVNFIETGGLVPDVAAPFWESFITNKNYQGIPLYNDSEFLENNPEASKVYSNTGDLYIAISRWINELGGGDEVSKSKLDTKLTNPAIMQHIVEGYLGGLLTTSRQTAKLIGQPVKQFVLGQDVDPIPAREWPVVNRLYINTDKRNDDRYVKDRYYFYRDQAEKIKHDERGYLKRLDDPKYEQKYNELIESPEYMDYIAFGAMDKAVKDAHKLVKEYGDEYKEFEIDAMRNLVNALDEDAKSIISPEDWGKSLRGK